MENDNVRGTSPVTATPRDIRIVVGFGLLLAGVLLLVGLFTQVTAVRLLGLLGFAATVSALAMLEHRNAAVRAARDWVFAAWWWILAWWAATFLLVGPVLMLRNLLPRIPLVLQLVILSVWGGLLALALHQVATTRRREWLFTSLRQLDLARIVTLAPWMVHARVPSPTVNIGILAPISYSLIVLMLALGFFSSGTYLMLQHGVLEFGETAARQPTPEVVMDFYLWHFLEAVPLLKVNQTLLWEQPLTYTSVGVGWLLLLFKLTVVVPLMAAFVEYWRVVRGEKK